MVTRIFAPDIDLDALEAAKWWEPPDMKMRDRLWSEYPTGTRAHAFNGGAWFKTERGWKWNGPDGSGGTFPTPGGDAIGRCVELPVAEGATK